MIRKFAAAVCVGLLMLCCFSLTVRAAGHDKDILKFAWTVPSKALVTASGTKKGISSKTTYWVDVTAGPSAGQMRVSFRDFSIISMNGQPIRTPEQKAQLAPILALTAMIPTYIINTDGTIAGLENFDIDTMLEQLLKTLNPPPDSKAMISKIFSSPQTRELIQASTDEQWNYWVGFWVDTPIAPGDELKTETAMQIGNAMIPGTVTMEHHGYVRDCLDCVRLTGQTIFSGEAMIDYLISLLKSGGLPPEKIAQFSNKIKSVSKITDLEIVTNKNTMRPAAVFVKSISRVTGRNGRVQDQVETKDFRFQWF